MQNTHSLNTLHRVCAILIGFMFYAGGILLLAPRPPLLYEPICLMFAGGFLVSVLDHKRPILSNIYALGLCTLLSILLPNWPRMVLPSAYFVPISHMSILDIPMAILFGFIGNVVALLTRTVGRTQIAQNMSKGLQIAAVIVGIAWGLTPSYAAVAQHSKSESILLSLSMAVGRLIEPIFGPGIYMEADLLFALFLPITFGVLTLWGSTKIVIIVVTRIAQDKHGKSQSSHTLNG